LEGIHRNRETVIIDTEYSGFDNEIKAMLIRHIHNAGIRLHKETIFFAQVGDCRAHDIAWKVNRGLLVPDHSVTEGELMRLVK